MQSLVVSKEEYIDVKKAARILSVSEATIKNWIKTDKIQVSYNNGKTQLFNKKDIYHLRDKIFSGEFKKLQNRRNKKAIKGNFLPMNYVESAQYISLAEEVCSIAEKMENSNKISLILHQIALKLLIDRGHIKEEKIATQPYLALLRELYSYGWEDVSKEDFHLLEAISNLPITFLWGQDFLGLIYLSLRNMSERKSSGSYYTPTCIVKNLVGEGFSYVKHEKISVIDPCCGSGNFLIEVFIKLLEKNNDPLYTEKDILKQITGIDIDPIAVSLTKINLALHLNDKLENNDGIEIYVANTLEHINCTDKKYDMVIGNPPWGSNFSKKEELFLKSNYKVAKVSIESFALFLEQSFYLVKETGVVSFIVPESVLYVKMHFTIRSLILQKAQIKVINILGDQFSNVFAPSIALTMVCNNKKEKKENLVVKNNGTFYCSINQKRFLKNQLYIFNVKTPDKEYNIVQKMRNLPTAVFLKDNAEFALGIVTGDNTEHVKKEKPPGGEVILRGNNIFRYNYYKDDSYIKFNKGRLQQVAPERLYRSPEKLIYRFINTNLVFAYDNQGVLTLNSANILIPRIDGLDVKYILAILNSRAAQFFYVYSYHSVKVLKKYIESIPIPLCRENEQVEVIQRVDLLLKTENPRKREKIYESIDLKVMDLFHFTKEEQSLIKNRINEIKFL